MVAKAIAEILDAEIKWPEQINPEDICKYDITGFGSGIYSAKHDLSLLKLADELPEVNNKNAFLFNRGNNRRIKKS